MEKNRYEFEETAALDDEAAQFDEGNETEAAEEIELLVRCVHAARQCGA